MKITDPPIGDNGRPVAAGVVCRCGAGFCPAHGGNYYDDFPEAFSYVREIGRPATLTVKGQTWKLFPSGRAEQK